MNPLLLFFVIPAAFIAGAVAVHIVHLFGDPKPAEGCQVIHGLCETSFVVNGHGTSWLVSCNGIAHPACGSDYCAEHHREKCKGECIAPGAK